MRTGSAGFRNINVKRSALVGYTTRPDDAIVIIHYFLDNGQANARTLELRATMQPLEQAKYLLTILLIESNAIV